MTRSPVAVPASPRGSRLPHGWLLLVGAFLIGLLLVLACTGKLPARDRPWPPSAGRTPIGPGETHTWSVDMAAGGFLDAVVEQDGIDLVIELSDPGGRVLFQADSTDDWAWEEELAWVVEQPGRYRLAVRPLAPEAAPGSYRIRVDGPRPALPADRTRMRAVREMRESIDIKEPGKRIALMERVLARWRELGDRRREAETLHQIATVTGEEADRFEEASARFAEAAALWQELGIADKRTWSQALALFYQGRFLLKEDPRAAFGYLSRALPLAQQSHRAGLEMRIAYHLGYVCDDLAEKQAAMQHYKAALEIARKLRSAGYEADSLNSLGLVYFSLGDQERAKELCQEAVTLSHQKKLVAQESSALNNLALIHDRNEPAKARDYFNQSLELGRKTGDAELQAAALINLAFLENRLGDPDQALKLGRQALALGASNLEVSARQAIGTALRKRNDLAASRSELEAALDLSRVRQDRVRESQVIPELARTARAQGDLRGALSLLRSGVAVVESIRTEVVEEDLRARFLASRQDVYSLTTDILMTLDQAEPGQGHAAEALRSSERARARSLLDILSKARADLRAGTLTQPEPLSVAGIRSELLDGRALLLEYSLGEERSFLWVVSPGGLQSFVLPRRDRIESAARRYYQALSAHPLTPEGDIAATALQAAADELSRMLLLPVKPLLSGQPLLVVSDGALQYIPFGSLPAPSSLDEPERVPLIAGHEVVSLPSASVLAVLRRELAGRPRPPKTLAVLADPVFQPADPRVAAALKASTRGLPSTVRAAGIDPNKLPRLRWAEKEANAIAGLVPAGQRLMALGFQATRGAATGGALGQYRMVHIATHGLIDSRNPELSSLVLSLVDERGRPQNGFLRLHDIYNLSLNADLVVLSACQTALGQEIRGEGLVGLTRGFMYAGASRVLASLWSVDDRATSELMQLFYRHMISDRMSPSEALRQAQIELSRKPNRSSPYYWAAFSLQGEWR